MPSGPFGNLKLGLKKPGVWWMIARNLSLLLYLGNQVDGEFPIAGVNGAYYTGEFVYINL